MTLPPLMPWSLRAARTAKHSILPSELTRRYGKPGTLTCHNMHAPSNETQCGQQRFLQLRRVEGGRRMRFLVTLALDAPDDADPQGIKEKSGDGL